jgi:hypothetical protein
MSLDVVHARVAFRDRSLLDVLDLALRFIVAHWRAFGLTFLFDVVPAFAAAVAIASAAGPTAGWLAAIVIGSFAQAPFTVLASRLVFQDEVRARDALGGAASELGRLLGVRILWSLIALAGSFVIIGPIWAGSAFLFVDEVLILERARIGQAFGRANRVNAGAFGDALHAFLLLLVVQAIAIALGEIGGRILLAEILQFRPPASLFDEGWSVLSFGGWFLALPFVATARFFIYLNARTRTEGWDIQTRFAAIAARAAAEAKEAA